MSQTRALIVDAYRELNSKKLFWITMYLCGFVPLFFLLIGIDSEGVTFVGYHLPLPVDSTLVTPSFFFRQVFVGFGVKLWLAWVAIILALVSTAGIFPDLVASGSIDLYLSKPIARWRFFLIKYFTGLLFVTLQVAVFVAASALVLRVRAGEWFPKVFLALPIVVIYFSYVYAVCVLLGLLTRSTVSSMLLTVVCMLSVFAVDMVESESFLKRQFKAEIELNRVNRQIDVERQTAEPGPKNGFWHAGKRRSMDELLADQREAQQSLDFATKWHRMSYAIETILPKSTDTLSLLHRWLVNAVETKRAAGDLGDPSTEDEPVQNVWTFTTDDMRADYKTAEAVRSRPISWSIGTSLIFEAVVVSVAGCIFCRRDY